MNYQRHLAAGKPQEAFLPLAAHSLILNQISHQDSNIQDYAY